MVDMDNIFFLELDIMFTFIKLVRKALHVQFKTKVQTSRLWMAMWSVYI
jgi:hypothetical protein